MKENTTESTLSARSVEQMVQVECDVTNQTTAWRHCFTPIRFLYILRKNKTIWRAVYRAYL